MRHWLRGARRAHADWLFQQGVQQVVTVDRDLSPDWPRSAPRSGGALNALIRAAVRYRLILGLTYPLLSLIGTFST